MANSLTPEAVERLLDLREPVDTRHAAVAALLVAAAGPARPAELAGEDATVRGFRQAHRRTWRRRRSGLAAIAAAAIVSLGGTAYAAGGDHLPAPLRHTVESLLGGAAERPGPTARPPLPSPPSPVPRSTPPPSLSPTTTPTQPSAARLAELCRAWEAGRTDPHAPQVTGEDRRTLAHAARSETGINDYCRGLLGSAATKPGGGPSRTHPVKPSHP